MFLFTASEGGMSLVLKVDWRKALWDFNVWHNRWLRPGLPDAITTYAQDEWHFKIPLNSVKLTRIRCSAQAIGFVLLLLFAKKMLGSTIWLCRLTIPSLYLLVSKLLNVDYTRIHDEQNLKCLNSTVKIYFSRPAGHMRFVQLFIVSNFCCCRKRFNG